MTIVNIGSYSGGLDIVTFADETDPGATWKPIEATSSSYSFSTYGMAREFVGSGLTYNKAGFFTGGVITGYHVAASAAGDQGLSFDGFSLPATTMTVWRGDSPVYAFNLAVLSGDDSITGGAGRDTLRGWAGNDTIAGGDGDDVVDGGMATWFWGATLGGPDPTQDTSNYLRGEGGNDTILGSGGHDDINGNQGSDTCEGGAGDDWVVGGKDDDVVHGDDGDDIVLGNLGNDTCAGGAGDDTVRGGQGDDSVAGGTGDDWLSGDLGDDTVAGGPGADIFHGFGGAGLDRVLDFNRAEGDRVQLDPGTAYTVSQAGADVVIDIAGGGQMVLAGVSMASLTGAWIYAA